MTVPVVLTLGVAVLLVATVVAVAVVLRRRFGTAVVRGGSMAPTFADGERVLIARAPAYGVGDVVVFRIARPVGRRFDRDDPAYRIKRVAAVAGDPVPPWLRSGAAAVPAGCVVVSGDNARSQDSRHLGFVPVARVTGRVIRRLR